MKSYSLTQVSTPFQRTCPTTACHTAFAGLVQPGAKSCNSKNAFHMQYARESSALLLALLLLVAAARIILILITDDCDTG